MYIVKVYFNVQSFEVVFSLLRNKFPLKDYSIEGN